MTKKWRRHQAVLLARAGGISAALLQAIRGILAGRPPRQMLACISQGRAGCAQADRRLVR